jgi:hypothetical protein
MLATLKRVGSVRRWMSNEMPEEIAEWLGKLYDEVEELTSFLQPASQLGATGLVPFLLSEGCKPLYAVGQFGFGAKTNLDFQCGGGYIILYDMPDFNDAVTEYKVFTYRRGDEDDVKRFNKGLEGMFRFEVNNIFVIVGDRIQLRKDTYLLGFSNTSLSRAFSYGWPTMMVYRGATPHAILITKHKDVAVVQALVRWQSTKPIITSAYEHREEIDDRMGQIMSVAKPLLKVGTAYILY